MPEVPTFCRVFRAARRHLLDRGAPAWLQFVQPLRCGAADREHAASERQYAHARHRFLRVCYAGRIDRLALPWKLGIALHELGHLIAGGPSVREHSERAANEAAEEVSGLRIIYKGRLDLEWTRPPKWLVEDLRCRSA